MGSGLWGGEASQWLRSFAFLVLRVDRRVRARGVWSLDYYGPEDWRREVETVQAQEWLTGTVLRDAGIEPAAVRRASTDDAAASGALRLRWFTESDRTR